MLCNVISVSRLIFSPEVDSWDKGNHLKNALHGIGLELATLDAQIESARERIDAAIAQTAQTNWPPVTGVHHCLCATVKCSSAKTVWSI